MSDEQPIPTEVKQSAPVGVKVIAVLYYISAVLGIIFGLLLLVGAGTIGTIVSQSPFFEALGAAWLFVIAGIIMIGLSVFGFFIGRGLWKARPWARIVAIILTALGILIAVILIIQGDLKDNILSLVINSIIAGYLLFNNNVKQAFTKI
tara:strand:- start:52 stop:498 length:447 start_codon:yes stop_codon:yes gene_type:complete